MNDESLVEFARWLATKNKYKVNFENNVRQILRLLGRVLLVANQELEKQGMPGGTNFEELLKPMNFEFYVQCCQKAAGLEDGVTSGAQSLKLGAATKNLLSVLISLKIQKEDEDNIKRYKGFETLMEKQWSTFIGAPALDKYRLSKLSKTIELPSHSSISAIREHSLKKMTDLLEQPCRTMEECKSLMEPIYLYLSVFNIRRSGDVNRLLMSAVDNLIEDPSQQLTDEAKQQLQEDEIDFAKRNYVVYATGKKTRNLPLLLNNTCFEALKKCYSARKTFNTLGDRFFQLPGLRQAVRGSELFCKYSLQTGVKVTSTGLRKAFATSLQFLNPTNSEKEMICDGMGHQMKVHNDIYRQMVSFYSYSMLIVYVQLELSKSNTQFEALRNVKPVC